ncbi:TIGR02996 domain-containing protein [Pyxidicoccus xibeiensis]|uniref:TIGR02996 domain-containing protein n=1 Tax=Pyxidicoccus xibeiensis TaxID=2906759 RepID=UPI0020A73A48|nr:TIGR02996 domain-containing protein [Pyxidicoccus xibeiensis]MCP3143809.1 TIGR02996 domain-containing protein [Pyxidicoccus xibeiensis]
MSQKEASEELLSRVYSHPDDDSARLVLADLLLEQDDPLGEFIMLQCASQPDEARVRALLQQHGLTWQAPLGPLIHPGATRFERGFPVSVRMSFFQQPRPAPGPAWGTVREISLRGSLTPLAADWLASPHLHAVTRMHGMHAAIARRLGAYPLPVRRLEVEGRAYRESHPDTFLALSALPHLTWVDVPDAAPGDVSQCATSPMARRLERFTASSSEDWFLAATPSEEVTVSVTLLREEGVGELEAAIRAAVGFGTRALRLVSRPRLEGASLRLLKEAAAAYARTEWV